MSGLSKRELRHFRQYEDRFIVNAIRAGMSFKTIAIYLNRSYNSVRCRWMKVRYDNSLIIPGYYQCKL